MADDEENPGEAQNVAPVNYRTPKLPKFFRNDPELWFAQAEAMFLYARLTSERARAGAVISVLDFDVIQSVRDLVTSNQPILYTELKERLISNFATSPENNLRQLLKGEILNEGNPSLVLSRIRNLSGGQCSDEVIRAIFIEQLPCDYRVALALSETTDLQRLGKLADIIHDTAGASGLQTAAV
ncbi:uncharacterized protein LOC127278571 [Leptopilina boulardi]|uniref:uncharacterized protein LOC127278571 n=1 Tax=Leptopilina boulardi TaxID=63433 RepID=UPI0021F61DB6|nr:uncharacterized protein LOC127278571 [Leptopilina boulardi]